MKKLFFIGILSIILIAPFIVGAVTIDNPLKTDDINELIKTIATIISGIALAVGIVMIVIAGIQYIASAGNEEKAKKARQTITNTLIGVAIVVSASFIVGIITEILGKSD